MGRTCGVQAFLAIKIFAAAYIEGGWFTPALEAEAACDTAEVRKWPEEHG